MILFVNACIRGEKSRTLVLCREYLAAVKARGEIVREVNLEQMHLAPLNAQKVAFRSQLARRGLLEDQIFGLSHQFAEADEIVIGAPYWDLSFPSALRVYIEHISVDHIVFHYTEEGTCEGLCKAQRIVYITTSGGTFGHDEEGRPLPGTHMGYEYLKAFAKMAGIGEVVYVGAEGLDIVGANINEQIDAARESLSKLIASDDAQPSDA